MIKVELRTIEANIETDIVCDACNQSCITDPTAPLHSTAEYATMIYDWGYSSKGLDDLHGQHHLCQGCWETALRLLKIKHPADKLLEDL